MSLLKVEPLVTVRVAVPRNPVGDMSLMKRVNFVMKERVVYRLNSARWPEL